MSTWWRNMSQFSTATRLMLLMHAGDPTFARTCNSNLPIKYELLITNQIRIDEDKCEEELLAICCVFFSGGFVSVVLSHVGRCFCILWLHTFFFSFSPSAVITNFKFILFFCSMSPFSVAWKYSRHADCHKACFQFIFMIIAQMDDSRW